MSLDFEIRLEKPITNKEKDLIEEIVNTVFSEVYIEPMTVDCKRIVYLENFNITHNLIKMAKEAGIYKALWHPNENGYFVAGDVIDVLQGGYDDFLERPEYYKQFNSPNGWGMYKSMVPFVEDVIRACKRYPNAKIETST